jgi:UDP:flavonoid glycosyltransferase YjiC (YdhE family)
MRVLFCSVPGLGHFFPLVQLAWSLRTAGHEVLVAIAEHVDRAAATGLDVVDVAPDYDSVAIFERTAREHPDFARTVGSRPAVDLVPWAVALAGVNRPLIEGTLRLADRWRPDLVVYDQGATSGLFAAAHRGIPAVQRNLGGFRTHGLHAAVAAHLTDLADRYDLRLPDPALTVEFFPPSMLGGPPEGWFMRWVPFDGGGLLSPDLLRPPERPRIAVTMGSIELQTFGVGTLKRLVAEAAAINAEFVLALGDIDAGPLLPLPPNVRSIGWAPLRPLLGTCTAVIHHGGGGSTLTAVDAGTAQLLAPDPRDQFQHVTGLAVRERGIGRVTTADKVDAAMITALLADDGQRAAAAEVRAEIAALPSPADTAARIVRHLS